MCTVIKKVSFCISLIGLLAVLPQVYGAGQAKFHSSDTETKTRSRNDSGFLLGKGFVVARMSAASMSSDRAAFNSAAVDLMYLVELLGETSETVELRAVLRAMLNGKIDAAHASAGIDEALVRYSIRQSVDDRWYLESGAATARMVYSAFHADAKQLEADLAKIASLSSHSPKDIDAALLSALKGLRPKSMDGQVTDEEFQTLTEQGLAIFKRIEG